MKPSGPDFTSRARRDLVEIRDWTIQTWGIEQWQSYYRGMAVVLRRIAADPQCGRARGLLGKGMRSMPYERHLIFFAPVSDAEGRVVILRIVHQRRNLAALSYGDDLEG